MNVQLQLAYLYLSCSIVGQGRLQAQTTDADKQQSIELIVANYAPIESVYMQAHDTHRDSFNTYAVSTKGSFAVKMFDKDTVSNFPSTPKNGYDWRTIPIHYVYYDGDKTLYSSFSSDPAFAYEETKTEEPLPTGSVMQIKPCLWPILPELVAQGNWNAVTPAQSKITIESLYLEIVFDEFGRVLSTIYTPPPKSGTHLVARWEYKGYDAQGEHLFPTSMIQSYLGTDRKGAIILDNSTHYKLLFDVNPNDIRAKITFDNRDLLLNKRDGVTGNVFSPTGELLYNEQEIQDEYNKAVGFKDPIKTRNILFTIIGILGLGSIVIWKRKAA